jgi:hypothetical protein
VQSAQDRPEEPRDLHLAHADPGVNLDLAQLAAIRRARSCLSRAVSSRTAVPTLTAASMRANAQGRVVAPFRCYGDPQRSRASGDAVGPSANTGWHTREATRWLRTRATLDPAAAAISV